MLKYVTGPITKADAGGLEAIISTPRVDADGESVDPMGLTNRDDWLANPLIYWAHEWAFDPSAEPIGKGTRLDVHADRIESSAVYAPTAKAQNVRALVSGGFVRKTSIGFDPLHMESIKGVPTHTQWALREWSIVPMPANTEATITGVKSALRWLADEISEGEPDQVASNVIVVRLDASELLRAIETLPGMALVPTSGSLTLTERGKRIAVIHRRRMADLPS
jgi:HK97 family phage prohead protease